MANDLNMCNFIGRLGKDPESRSTQNGDQVSSFSIAVGWKSKDKEGAEWVNITAFGKLAEICNTYLTKGSQVFIAGRFKTEKFTNKDGIEVYSTKIIADTMQMLGGKQSNNAEGGVQEPAPPRATPKQTFGNPAPAAKPAQSFSDMDEIPF